MPALTLAPSPVVERLPALDGVVPADAADAFRDLPGLALLESARRGRAGRWSFLVAEPVAVLEGSAPGADPFAAARAALARLDRSPLGAGRTAVRRRARRPPRLRARAAPGASPGGGGSTTRGCPTCAWASMPGRSPGTGATGGRGWPAGRSTATATALERALAGVRARAEGALRVPLRGRAGVPPPDLPLRGGPGRAGWPRVEAVRAAIAAGELYQANLTRRLVAPFDGDPWPLFRRLRAGEPAAFTAYFSTSGGDPAAATGRAIVSASPEPFLALDAAGRVRTDPIKGTRPRGRTPAEDRALAAELLASEKDRAENTMIVDVLRNDLGRVCRPGSVRVPRLWRLERTPSVQHLVST